MTVTSAISAVTGILIALCLSGCRAGTDLAATEVLNEANCKGAEVGLRKVSYADVAKLRGSTLLAMSTPTQTDTAAPELLLFALSKGRQPTPGYFFHLTDARVSDQVAELTLAWEEPAPERVQAQIVTFPCIVVAVEPGDYSVIRAAQENGELLGELRI